MIILVSLSFAARWRDGLCPVESTPPFVFTLNEVEKVLDRAPPMMKEPLLDFPQISTSNAS